MGLPSKLVPAPHGVTGIFSSWANLRIWLISIVHGVATPLHQAFASDGNYSVFTVEVKDGFTCGDPLRVPRIFLIDSNSLSVTLPYSIDEYSTPQLFLHPDHRCLSFFDPLSLWTSHALSCFHPLTKRSHIFFYPFFGRRPDG